MRAMRFSKSEVVPDEEAASDIITLDILWDSDEATANVEGDAVRDCGGKDVVLGQTWL